MSKLSKAERARINGAKSKGPVTPEGKAKSSQNARKHGLYSDLMVLDTEEEGAYNNLSDLLLAHYTPRNIVEEDLVRDMIDARWRLNRVKGMEKAALNLQMAIQTEEVKAKFQNMDTPTQTALAAVELVDTSQLLPFLQRLDTKFTRLIHRTIQLLAQLQSDMPPRQNDNSGAGGPSITHNAGQSPSITQDQQTAAESSEPAAPPPPVARRSHFLTPERYAAVRAAKATPQPSPEIKSIKMRNEPTEARQSPSAPVAEREMPRYFLAA